MRGDITNIHANDLHKNAWSPLWFYDEINNVRESLLGNQYLTNTKSQLLYKPGNPTGKIQYYHPKLIFVTARWRRYRQTDK